MPVLSAYDQTERRRLYHAEIEASLLPALDAFHDAVDALRDRLPSDATALNAIEAYVADSGFTGAVARQVHQELRAEIEADAADRADNEPLRWLGKEEEFGGDLLGDLPRDGYRSVVGALAAGLDIRFNTEVVTVQSVADGIRAVCAYGALGRNACSATPFAR